MRNALERTFFGLGACFAFLGVAFGAFGAHALAERIPAERLVTFEIAVRYQMYHALALLAVAWGITRWPGGGLHVAGWFFVAGIVIFGLTLYGIALGGPRWLGAITPLGGLCFLLGWSLVIRGVWRA